ncbi:hypothetical protein [Bradyrhizobium sp. Tv2a-2]|uniref:hypothetical protein n=1 Tax=Bradyrhizobium sp. Tv2a-2 TaxID=113395 RepID=UPI000429A9D2|nr:hypothetical protein [Bradyrhizobium sp. Tv2a-2]
MTLDQKKLLERHGEHFAAMSSYVRECSPDELQELLDAARAARSTNCWWASYYAAQFLIHDIEAEQRRRARPAAVHQ